MKNYKSIFILLIIFVFITSVFTTNKTEAGTIYPFDINGYITDNNNNPIKYGTVKSFTYSKYISYGNISNGNISNFSVVGTMYDLNQLVNFKVYIYDTILNAIPDREIIFKNNNFPQSITVNFKVYNPPSYISEIQVDQENITMNVKEICNINVTGIFEDNSQKDITNYANYARIDNATNIIKKLEPGAFEAVQEGKGDVIIGYGDKTKRIHFTVLPYIPVIGIIINQQSITLTVDDPKQILQVTILPSDATNKEILLTSSNSYVISIVDNQLVPMGIGESTITATTKDGGFSTTCKLNVIESETQPNEGSFIATAAYGSYLDPHVYILRNFRDNILLKFNIGKWFINQYYQYSPPIAAIIAQNDYLKFVVRILLTPIIYCIEYPSLILLTIVLIFIIFKRKYIFN